MATFGQPTAPIVTKPTIPASQIVQRVNSRLQGVESAIQTIGTLLGQTSDNGNIGGTVYARITHLQGQLVYELSSSKNNTTLLGAAGKYYYDPTQFKSGVIDRYNKGTNVRLALTDLDNAVSALGNNAEASTDWQTYSLATGHINSDSKNPTTVPHHLGTVRNNPYSSTKDYAYNPETHHLLPNRVVRHGTTVREALEAINEVIGNVGESLDFQYLGAFTSNWLGGNLTIKACFEHIAQRIDFIDADNSSNAQFDALSDTVATQGGDIGTNAGNVSNEVFRATGAEAALSEQIATEKNRAIAVETVNAAAIGTENIRATGEETVLATAIGAEETRAKGVETTLTGQLNIERDRAVGKETENAAAIVTERSRAVGEEEANKERVETEVLRADLAEKANKERVETEVLRADLAEKANAASIVAEMERALKAEQDITTLVGTETNRAQTEEASIRAHIADEITDVKAITSGILQNTIPPLSEQIDTNKDQGTANASSVSALQNTVSQNHATVSGEIDGLKATVNQLVAQATNNEQIAANLEKINANTSTVELNLLQINANAADVSGNLDKINTNTGNAASNLEKINANTATASTNAGNIVANAGNAASNLEKINANTVTASTNAGNIVANAGNVASNLQTINANTVTAAANAGNIVANAGNVASNLDKINTNTGNAASNLEKINANATSASANLQKIHENTAGVNSNRTRLDNIMNNTTGEALDSLSEVVGAFQQADHDLNNTITNLTSTIAGQTAANLIKIDNNTANITGNVEDIAANTATASTNAGNIVANAGSVASNLQKINANTATASTNTATVSSIHDLYTVPTNVAQLENIVFRQTQSLNWLAYIVADGPGTLTTKGVYTQYFTIVKTMMETNDFPPVVSVLQLSDMSLENWVVYAQKLVNMFAYTVGNATMLPQTTFTVENVNSGASSGEVLANTENIASNLVNINGNTTSAASNLEKINTNTATGASNLQKINEVDSKVDLLGNIEGGDLTQLVGRVTSLETDVGNSTTNGITERGVLRDDLTALSNSLDNLNTLDDLAWGKDLAPATNDAIDVGTTNKRVRNLFANTMWLSDQHALTVVNSKFIVRRRATETIPDCIAAFGKTEQDALQYANTTFNTAFSALHSLTLEHWVAYYRTLSGNANAGADLVFQQPGDFQETIILNDINSLSASFNTSISELSASFNTSISELSASLGSHEAALNTEKERATLADAAHSSDIQALNNSVGTNTNAGSSNLGKINVNTGNITSNTQAIQSLLQDASEDLDSLKEVVEAFQNADSNLNQTITSLASGLDGKIGNVANLTGSTDLVAAANAAHAQASQNNTALGNEITRATANEAALASSIDSLEAGVQAATISVAAVTISVSTEKTRAEGIESGLQQSLNGEINRATVAEGILLQAVNNEKGRAEGAETTIQATLNAKIDSEIARAQGVETSINTTLGTEALYDSSKSVKAAVNDIKTALDNQASNAAVVQNTQTIQNNTTRIDNILNSTTDEALDSLSEIVTAFQQADTNLNQTITNLSTGTDSKIGVVASSVGALDGVVGGHAVALGQHAVTLGQHAATLGQHTTKISDAESAVLANAAAIVQEVARAQLKESNLEAATTAETNRATLAESNEAQRATQKEQENATNLQNEIQRATNQESTLQGNIDVEKARIGVIEATVGPGEITTTNKTLVGGITELHQSVQSMSATLGDPATLPANTNSVIAGLNAVFGASQAGESPQTFTNTTNIDTLNTAVDAHTGQITTMQQDITALETNGTNNSATTASIVALQTSVGDLETKVGTVELTTAKKNASEAINELKTALDADVAALVLTNTTVFTHTNSIGANTGNITQNSADIAQVNTVVGDTAGLDTTNKIVVGAINEVRTAFNSNKAAHNASINNLDATVSTLNQTTASHTQQIGALTADKAEKTIVDQHASTLQSLTTDVTALKSTVPDHTQNEITAINVEITGVQTTLGTESLDTGTSVTNAINALYGTTSANATKLTNLFANTTDEALDSLAEIVTAFNQADTNLTALVTNLGSSSASSVATEKQRAEAAELALETTVNQHTASLAGMAGHAATLAGHTVSLAGQGVTLGQHTSSLAGHGSSISTLTTALGTATLKTTAGTVKEALNEIYDAHGATSSIANTNKTSIDSIDATLATGTTLKTAASTIHPAINELHDEIGALELSMGNNGAVNISTNTGNITANTNAISAIQTGLGSVALFDSQSTVRGAINTVKQSLDTANGNVSGEIARATQKEQENSAGISNLTTTVVPGIQGDVGANAAAVTAINTTIGTETFPNQSLKASINSLVVAVAARALATDVSANTAQLGTNTGNIGGNSSTIQSINNTLGTAILQTNSSTVRLAINEVRGDVITEKNRAETAEATQATNLQSETARAVQEETAIRALIGTGALGVGTSLVGAVNALLAQINTLNGSFSVLESLVMNQKSLIVTGDQDHRSTDLSVFSEIIVQAGSTMTVTTVQVDAIASKKKNNGTDWMLTFTNNGTLRAVHTATAMNMTQDSLIFNALEVQSGTATMTLAQFQSKTVSKTGSGTVIVAVSEPADLQATDLSHVSEVHASASLTLTAAQLVGLTLVNTNASSVVVVVPNTVNTLSSAHLNAATSVLVTGTLILTPELASQNINKITKQGQGAVTTHLEGGTHDLRSLNYSHVDNLTANNAAISMTSAQADHYATTLNNSTVKVIETADKNYSPYDLGTWNFDEVLLQNCVLTVTPSQASFLAQKSVSKSNSTIRVHFTAPKNASALDFSLADNLLIESQVTIGPGHVHLTVTKQGAATIALDANETVNISGSTIPFDSVTVFSSTTLRLSPNQNETIQTIAGAGRVVLAVTATGNFTNLSTTLPGTVELSPNVQATFSLGQMLGKTVVKGSGAGLKATVGALNAHTLAGVPPAIDTMELFGNSRISTVQYSATNTFIKNNFNLAVYANNESLETLSLGNENNIELYGTIAMTTTQLLTATVQKFSGAQLAIVSNQTMDLSSTDVSSVDSLTHTNNTLTLSGSQIQSIPTLAVQGGAIALNIKSNIVHSARIDLAASIAVQAQGGHLEYTANSSADLVSDAFFNKVSNYGTVTVHTMYKTPPNNLFQNGVLLLPQTAMAGRLVWTNNLVAPLNLGDTENITDNTGDVHHPNPTKQYQWQRNDGLGYTDIAGETGKVYTVVAADIGTHLRLALAYTIDWYQTSPNNQYDPSKPALTRQAYSTPLFVNTSAVVNIILASNGTPANASNLQVNDTVTVTITDPDGIQGVPVYAWKRNGVATGSVAASYTVTSLDFGNTLSATFQYTDQQGSPESGTAVLGTLPGLTVAYGGGITEFSANSPFPTVQASHGITPASVTWFSYPFDGNKNMSTVFIGGTLYGVSGTNFYARIATGDGVVVDAAALPVRTYAPLGAIGVSGIVAENETLSLQSTVTDVNFVGANNSTGAIQVADFNTVQWYRSNNINGTGKIVVGTNSNYTVGPGDNGKYISATVTYTDGAVQHELSSTPKFSNSAGQVTLESKTATNRTIATNKMVRGDKIEVTVQDQDNIDGNITYQWTRDNALLGTSGAVHTLVKDDFSTTLAVQCTYTDQEGRSESITESVVFGSEPYVTLTDAANTTITGSLTAPVYLSVSNTFIGLSYTVYIDGSANANSTVANATGTVIVIDAPVTGKTVHVQVHRNGFDAVTTQTVKFADVTLALLNGEPITNAALGSTIQANVTGATVSTVEFFFEDVLVSRGSLGMHIITSQDLGNLVYVQVRDTDGYIYQSPSYTVPLQ